MIDPISALAMATAAFNGIKKAVEVGREIQDVYSQLSTWAGHVSDIQEYLNQRPKEPGLFDKIGFSKSATAEAFDELVAKQKLKEMEEEIRHMFLYGELNHLGLDGYREFIQMRRDIKLKREKLIYDQMRRQKEFFDLIKTIGLVTLILSIGISLLWFIFDITMEMARKAGRL
jgi:hypothetical protein